MFKINYENENDNEKYIYITTIGESSKQKSGNEKSGKGKSGNRKSGMKKPSNDNNHFNRPNCVAISPMGNYIYVSDSNNDRVQVFEINYKEQPDKIYKYIGTIANKFSKYSHNTYTIKSPIAIAVSNDNHIYIANSDSVLVFKIEYTIKETGKELVKGIDYKWITTFKPDDEYFSVYSIAIGSNNRIYIGSNKNILVFKISHKDNNNVYEYLKNENIDNIPQPKKINYIQLDGCYVTFSDNLIYICSNNCITVFRVNNVNDQNTYTRITQFGNTGSNLIKFDGLNSIAVSSNKLIYVTEYRDNFTFTRGNSRVQVFKQKD